MLPAEMKPGMITDPELVSALGKSIPRWTDDASLVELRSAVAMQVQSHTMMGFLPEVEVEDRQIPGPEVAENVLVRMYRMADEPHQLLQPALLWMHGGGFFLGDVSMNDSICKRIVVECGCMVVSVNYRLAPENPYPAGLDDCFTALSWLAANATDLAIDRARIAVGGSSAGGCLAAALTLRVRDQGGPEISYQLLVSPVLDDRHDTPSSRSFTDARLWNRSISLKSWAAYLEAVDEDIPIYASPGRAADLSGLPRTLVLVADQDLLRDEGITYAQRLMQAGVLTELHVYPGTFHGSIWIESADVSKRQQADLLYALKRALYQWQPVSSSSVSNK